MDIHQKNRRKAGYVGARGAVRAKAAGVLK